MKFDLLYLDISHSAPGEFINILEALPFLNNNAIVIIHDIINIRFQLVHLKFLQVKQLTNSLMGKHKKDSLII